MDRVNIFAFQSSVFLCTQKRRFLLPNQLLSTISSIFLILQEKGGKLSEAAPEESNVATSLRHLKKGGRTNYASSSSSSSKAVFRRRSQFPPSRTTTFLGGALREWFFLPPPDVSKYITHPAAVQDGAREKNFSVDYRPIVFPGRL